MYSRAKRFGSFLDFSTLVNKKVPIGKKNCMQAIFLIGQYFMLPKEL